MTELRLNTTSIVITKARREELKNLIHSRETYNTLLGRILNALKESDLIIKIKQGEFGEY